MPQKRKADNLTISNRVTVIARLVLARTKFSDIKRFATDQSWQISDRELQRYIELAEMRLAMTQYEKHQLLCQHLLLRRILYARAMKKNDFMTALHIVRDEAELLGLYPPAQLLLPNLDEE